MARSIIENDPSPGWLRARDELLQPLLKSNALPKARGEIANLILRVDQYDFCRSLRADPESSKDTSSELQRLIRRTFDTFSNGDPVAAREHLQAVRQIASQDPGNSYLTDFLDKTQERWDQQPLVTGRVELLNNLLEKTRTEIHGAGELSTTTKALKAALLLYAGDRTVTDQVAQIELLLNELSQRAN